MGVRTEIETEFEYEGDREPQLGAVEQESVMLSWVKEARRRDKAIDDGTEEVLEIPEDLSRF